MDKTSILKGFNNHLSEFFDDILVVFPDDIEIKKAHVSLSNLKKMNPRIIIEVKKNTLVIIIQNRLKMVILNIF